MEKKKLTRIIIPVCIVLVVAGIWIFKNLDRGNGDLEASEYDLEALAAYNLPIIVDFGADSCAPCREMAPVLKSMNEKMRGKAVIRFIDVWKHPEAADGLPIQFIPSQLFFNADKTPYVPGDDMEIEFTMYSYKDTGEHALTVHQGGLTEEQILLILSDMGVTG